MTELEKIKRISEIVCLEWTEDNKLFIDPYKVLEYDSIISSYAKGTLRSFFDEFFKAIKDSDIRRVREIGMPLHEINSTHLGYGTGKFPSGKGFSVNDLIKIYTEARKVRSISLEDFYDVIAFSENIGPDKISDLTTNLIYFYLIDYTIEVCLKNGIKFELIEKRVQKWDVTNKNWKEYKKYVPYVCGNEVTFIPVRLATHFMYFSYGSIYDELVEPYYRSNYVKYGLIRILKSGKTKPYIKLLRNKFPKTRNTVSNFAEEHIDLYRNYKKKKLERR